jgi:hypothetical protein
MFKSGTILELKDPREPSQLTDPYTGQPRFEKKRNPRTGEETELKDKPVMRPFPYNKVEVIGPSPITADRGEWQGADAAGVIIRPLSDFAGNLDEPVGKLKQLYTVVSVPEDVVPVERTIKVIDAHTNQAGESPEEVFAREAPGAASGDGHKRARTPFEDVKPEKGTQGTSPL